MKVCKRGMRLDSTPMRKRITRSPGRRQRVVRCYLVGYGFSCDKQRPEQGSKFTGIAVEFATEDDESAHERPDDEARETGSGDSGGSDHN